MGRSHTYASIVIRLSYRTAILCVTLGNTQERDHTDVAIVENLSHRNIISSYTQGYTLGRSHTYVAIVTRLSLGRLLFQHLLKIQTGEKSHLWSHCYMCCKSIFWIYKLERSHTNAAIVTWVAWKKNSLIVTSKLNLVFHFIKYTGENPSLWILCASSFL